ncbi:MAG: TSUP family transporter, partial [Spirochaetales bacterium]|nr:TSUP family transporter [Spirochaetales bacterium]
IGGISGGLLGKYVFDIALSMTGNEKIIGAVQSLLLSLMVLGVFFFLVYKQKIVPKKYTGVVFTLFIGLTLGSIASFLGIGGGPINIAVLYYFFSMTSKKAALNSIFIIFLSQTASLLFTAASGLIPHFIPAVLIVMITGGVLGGLSGSFVAHVVSLRGVDKIFGVVLLIILALSTANFVKLLLALV